MILQGVVGVDVVAGEGVVASAAEQKSTQARPSTKASFIMDSIAELDSTKNRSKRSHRPASSHVSTMATSPSPLQLVVLHGLPAVGKLTVAKQLAEATSFKLFHNHLVVGNVLPHNQYCSCQQTTHIFFLARWCLCVHIERQTAACPCFPLVPRASFNSVIDYG